MSRRPIHTPIISIGLFSNKFSLSEPQSPVLQLGFGKPRTKMPTRDTNTNKNNKYMSFFLLKILLLFMLLLAYRSINIILTTQRYIDDYLQLYDARKDNRVSKFFLNAIKLNHYACY